MGALRDEVLVCGDDDEVRRELTSKVVAGVMALVNQGPGESIPVAEIAAVEA
jgi:hypothetical protein